MPHIHKLSPQGLTHDLSEAFLCLIAFHHCTSFHTVKKYSAHSAFVNRTVCLLWAACVLTFPSPYLSWSNFQLNHDSLSLPKTWLFGKVHPPPPRISFSLFVCGSKITNLIFVLLVHPECGSVLLVWQKNNEDKAGLCGDRNAFLTHVNEWRLTFHSSRPFTEWQH